MAGNEIGDLKFKVDADTAPAAASIEALKAKTEAAAPSGVSGIDVPKTTEEWKAYIEQADKVRAETAKIAEGANAGLGEGGVAGKLRAAKKLYGEQIEVVQGLIGKFLAVGAVATTFYNIGKVIGDQIVDKLESAAEKAANFTRTLDTSDAKGATKKTADRIAELNAEIAKTDELMQQVLKSGGTQLMTFGLSNLFVKDKDKLIEERDRLVKILPGFSNRIAEAAASATAKVAEKEQKDAEDKAKQAEEKALRDQASAAEKMAELKRKAAYDVMSDEEKILADSQQARDELIATHNKMSMEDRLANEQDIADALENINKKQDDAFKRIVDERNKHMEEVNKKMEEAAKRVSDAWVTSFRSIREASNSVFNTDQAASMVQFAQQMQVTATMASANMNRIVVEGVG